MTPYWSYPGRAAAPDRKTDDPEGTAEDGGAACPAQRTPI